MNHLNGAIEIKDSQASSMTQEHPRAGTSSASSHPENSVHSSASSIRSYSGKSDLRILLELPGMKFSMGRVNDEKIGRLLGRLPYVKDQYQLLADKGFGLISADTFEFNSNIVNQVSQNAELQNQIFSAGSQTFRCQCFSKLVARNINMK